VIGGMIDMNESCRLCRKLTKEKIDLESNPWDTIILQSQNFVVLPTVGAIVKGWVLVVPKKHYLCMGALENYLLAELNELCDFVSSKLQSYYGPVAIFEHGPSKPKQLIGCGVDHAHLHIVPTRCNLVEGVRQVFTDSLKWNGVTGIKEATKYYIKGLPYLYINQPMYGTYLATHKNIPSQLFRKAISLYAGVPHRYDWRNFPEKDNVIDTLETLKEWKIQNNIDSIVNLLE